MVERDLPIRAAISRIVRLSRRRSASLTTDTPTSSRGRSASCRRTAWTSSRQLAWAAGRPSAISATSSAMRGASRSPPCVSGSTDRGAGGLLTECPDPVVDREGTDPEGLVRMLAAGREEQGGLLGGLDAEAWTDVRTAGWGWVPLRWVVTTTCQHTAEHTNDVLRIALFWDARPGQGLRADQGRSDQGGDRPAAEGAGPDCAPDETAARGRHPPPAGTLSRPRRRPRWGTSRRPSGA